MDPCFQNLFVTHEGQKPLRYIGSMEGNRWSDGQLVGEDDIPCADVQNGIPSFVRPRDDGWGTDAQVESLLAKHGVRRERLIAENWEASLHDWTPSSDRYAWIQRIVTQGGLMLEIACGPGGGFSPLILDLNPDARLLVNDIGWWILVEWKKFSDWKHLWSHASFAQFDVTRCPLRSDSFDCVDSAGGFSNIEGTDRALTEIYRILRPDGRLFMSDADVDPSSFQQLPDAEQEAWLIRFPQQGKGYEQILIKTGFEILQLEETAKTLLRPQESALAEMGTKYGTPIYLRQYRIEARKPL